jgi:hypothetical protein
MGASIFFTAAMIRVFRLSPVVRTSNISSCQKKITDYIMKRPVDYCVFEVINYPFYC